MNVHDVPRPGRGAPASPHRSDESPAIESAGSGSAHPAGSPFDDIASLCSVESNPYTNPEFAGADAFEARAEEIPGLLAYGRTPEEARARWHAIAIEELQSASQARRRQLDATRAHVQFNLRIPSEEKLQIARRAAEAGLSVRQFVRNQCLLADVWSPPSTMSADEREVRWRSMAKGDRTRPPAGPPAGRPAGSSGGG